MLFRDQEVVSITTTDESGKQASIVAACRERLPSEQECNGRRILLTQRLISVRWED
jgi:hypothetical protein